MTRFDAYARNPSIDLVIAYKTAEPIGQTWGWPLGKDTTWWQNLKPGSNIDTSEDGHRTFALSEIMVAQSHTGQGIARALHDELLRGRSEKRATLLVDPGNAHAAKRYAQWGWKQAGHLQPSWPDAPRFEVLLLQLPPG